MIWLDGVSRTIGDHSPRLWSNPSSPCGCSRLVDQKIGSLMVMLLALLMSLEAKRITNMPPITGYLVVFLLMAQSIPQWVIDRPVVVITGARYWWPPWCWFIQKIL